MVLWTLRGKGTAENFEMKVLLKLTKVANPAGGPGFWVYPKVNDPHLPPRSSYVVGLYILRQNLFGLCWLPSLMPVLRLRVRLEVESRLAVVQSSKVPKMHSVWTAGSSRSSRYEWHAPVKTSLQRYRQSSDLQLGAFK